LAALEAEFESELQALGAPSDPLAEKLEPVSLRANKSDVSVRLVALACPPHIGAHGELASAWRPSGLLAHASNLRKDRVLEAQRDKPAG
ncbi:MAG: hypothetical protein ACRDIF_01150, partial [Actinomycetota bacterium]